MKTIMKNNFYYDLESEKIGAQTDLSAALDNLRFNDDGLIPTIAQQNETGEVLMMAWMNRASIEETLKTGQVCYWSRSRQAYWRKGESSGHVQKLVELRIDCDGDTLLCLVNQTGPACHTERSNCFFHAVKGDKIEIITEPCCAE